MNPSFNYRHLYYFWMTGKEGSLTAAAARLNMAIQTLSTQIKTLEHDLGCALLKPVGRGLTLTEAGIEAMQQADAIFQLGSALPQMVRDAGHTPTARLTIGIADGLPKLIVRRLLQPIMHEPNLRLRCHENGVEMLLSELALHRLDVVLADRAVSNTPSMKVYTHALGSSPIGWYAAPALWEQASTNFPHSLADLPILLPTTHAAIRAHIDHWFERCGIKPHIVGEFQDSALLKTFGSSGMGVFPAAEIVEEDLTNHYQVRRVGDCAGVEEQFFAIGTEKKILHPLVQRILPN